MMQNETTSDMKKRQAEGVMSCFGVQHRGKKSLYFEGQFIDGMKEELVRFITISKLIRAYKASDGSLVYQSDYPDIDKKYKCKIQVETWTWEGHKCMRVLAFQIDECLGENEDYSKKDERHKNPFYNK